MKNKKIIIPAMLFVLTTAVITPFLFAQAATTDSTSGSSNVQKMKNWAGNKKENKNFSRKVKTPLTTDQITARTVAKTAQETKIAAVNNALASNNYDSWVTAMAALNVNPNSSATATVKTNPKITALTSKITRENFSTLVHAYNLSLQLQSDLKTLGFSENYGKGMMPGLGMGMGFGLNK